MAQRFNLLLSKAIRKLHKDMPQLMERSKPFSLRSEVSVSAPMSLKWLLFVFIWQRGPLFNSKSLCHSELSRILTCVFQSMMPHLHTLLGRQSHDPVQADSQQGNDPYIHQAVCASGLLGQYYRCLEFGSSLAQGGVRLREVDHEQYPVELLIQQGRCRLNRFEANSCHRIYFANCNKFITFAVRGRFIEPKLSMSFSSPCRIMSRRRFGICCLW